MRTHWVIEESEEYRRGLAGFIRAIEILTDLPVDDRTLAHLTCAIEESWLDVIEQRFGREISHEEWLRRQTNNSAKSLPRDLTSATGESDSKIV